MDHVSYHSKLKHFFLTVQYDRILKDRVNPNGCPVTMTFYVTHDGGTNYEQVNKFYNQGHEMASHTVT